jgi:hypothetical protein
MNGFINCLFPLVGQRGVFDVMGHEEDLVHLLENVRKQRDQPGIELLARALE